MNSVAGDDLDMVGLWDDYQRSQEKITTIKGQELADQGDGVKPSGHVVRSPDGTYETRIRCEDASCCAPLPDNGASDNPPAP